MPPAARRRPWLPVVGTLAGLALAALLLRGRVGEVGAALGRTDWRPVLVAVAVLLAANAARAVRLRRLLPGPPLAPAQALEVTTTYNLLTGVVPGGLGELALPVRLARTYGTPRAEAASALLLTRYLDVAGLAGAVGLSAALTPAVGVARVPLAVLGAGGALAVAVSVRRLGRATAREPGRLRRRAGRGGRGGRLAGRLLSVRAALRRQAGAVDAVSWWTTAALWAGTWTGLVLLAGAVGTPVGLAAGGVLAGVVFALAALPVPALAGIGLTDAGWALGLVLLASAPGGGDLDRGTAVGAAFALHGLSLLAVAAVALVGRLALRRHRRTGRARGEGVPEGRAVAGLTALTGLHAALVWPTYDIGSFDDDGHYLLVARALAAGRGFVDPSRVGDPVDPLIPPGYPGLLAPLVAWLPGDGALAGRLLSLVCVLALVPLVHRWLLGAGVRRGARLAVLALLAGNVVLATYASMVMAEAPFLVLLVLTLLALQRAGDVLPGATRRRALAVGAGTGALLAGLVLLKTAAVGLVVGAGLWLLRRRHGTAAVAAGAVVAGTQLPLLLLRAAGGGGVVGDRYAGEIATFTGPGQVLASLEAYVRFVLADTVVPVGPFFGLSDALDDAFRVLQVALAGLVVLGGVVWWRRRRDAVAPMLVVYLAEVLLFPFTNERRVVLVLPVVLAWLVVGGDAAARATARLPRVPRTAARPLAAGALALALLGLAVQPARNYLYRPELRPPQPSRSAPLALLAELVAADRAAGREPLVQTSYRWTTALYTGADTDAGLFVRDAPIGLQPVDAPCPAPLLDEIADTAGTGYVLSAAWNRPGQVDDPCVRERLDRGAAGAVRLVARGRDLAALYQLLGPGSPWPDDVDHVGPGGDVRTGPAGVVPVGLRADGGAAPVRQVSAGTVLRADGSGVPASLQVRRPGSRAWRTVDTGTYPDVLLHRFDEPVPLAAVRVVAGDASPVVVRDLRATGPAAP